MKLDSGGVGECDRSFLTVMASDPEGSGPCVRIGRILFAALMLITSCWGSAGDNTLYTFDRLTGMYPDSALIFDGLGNLYGTTSTGGTPTSVCPDGCGVVFELTKDEHGNWTQKVLYSFLGQPDAQGPQGGLIFDGAGNLYGTTTSGGSNGGGTVFELMPQPDGTWVESVLYSFYDSPIDGIEPFGSLIWDAVGNLYGTTSSGGTSGVGTVFELAPVSGVWTEKVLYSFQGGIDGESPRAGLVMNQAGNLYGTTSAGGGSCYPHACGTVFELKSITGGWKEIILLTGSAHGETPLGALIFDRSGNLFGTSEYGGSHDAGIVFELTQLSDGKWRGKTIHSFDPAVGDGALPMDPMSFDVAGNLYGTTWAGGPDNPNCYQSGCGTVFKLSISNGNWREVAHYAFTGGSDGAAPEGGVIVDASGDVFGVTFYGGAGYDDQGYGVIFEIVPSLYP
jgi:uncharacterized repeat protein (TIGR03803 family)